MRHGDILKRLLNDKKMKISTLAKISGISDQTLYGIIRRNNQSTEPETLWKISKALDVPINIWSQTEEDLMLSILYGPKSENKILSKDSVDLALELGEKTIADISYSLKCLGYDYSPDMLQTIIDNEESIDYGLAETIEYILLHDTLLSKNEFDFLNRFRKLSADSKGVIENIINKFLQSDKFENEKLEEWADSLQKKDNDTSTSNT